MKFEKICVLGLGYIGLPTASLLANNGFGVVGVDKQEKIVEIINSGGIHIEEPGLKALVSAAVNSGLLKVKTVPEEADVFFIAVPTPVNQIEGSKVVNLDYVRQAAEDVTPFLKKGNLVVLESTSPPGTTIEVVVPILEKSGFKAGIDFFVVHCPERVLPGSTLRELVQNSRVIGGINEKSAETARELYRQFVEGEIILTDATTAEMVKLMENIYRDVNIALANELSNICIRTGINVWEAISLANMHPRVKLHLPGAGVGGHCISVDPWFIISAFREEARLISLSRLINDQQPDRVVEQLKSKLRGIDKPVVTIMGVAYKGNIDDTRESPALKVIDQLQQGGIETRVYDPHVTVFSQPLHNLKEAFSGSDCALLLTDHDEFRFLYPGELATIMRTRQVFDTRNCLDRKLWEANSFKYFLLAGGDK